MGKASGILLAIDPGNTESAYALVDMADYRPLRHDKVENAVMLSVIREADYSDAAIEQIASYGMAVGRDVFDTCKWIGRFTQLLEADLFISPSDVWRRDEKLCLCGDSRAKDANIRQALIDRFALHDMRAGKGTKKNPDWFYGFRADEWAAYAVAVTHIDTLRGKYKP
jgi:hypothetical protein